MEVGEILIKISSIKEEVYNYIINTEHWLFYWIANNEVQEFIKEYPEDYESMVHLHVKNLDISSMLFSIIFDEHPNDIESINRYAALSTFRDSVKAKWLEWNGKVKERQIEEKEEELAYHKKRISEIEKAILNLKNK